jgi:hypothetical protein
MIDKKQLFIYGCIVLLAFALRAYTPIPIDLIGDDATYAFRSVGYFDHMASQLQTTPYQWFEAVPWWAKLSFHDHPPAAFLFFHFFFSIFGMTTMVAHAIPILLGTLCAALCIAIGNKMGSPRIGMIAGILLAVNSVSVWISRVMYLEALLIPLLLITAYSALRARVSPSWWIIAGFAYGASFATKYTALFALPALCYLALYSINKKKWISLGVLAFITAIAPIIIYNIALYHTRGHFDYQLTRLLHITTADWPRLTASTDTMSLTTIFGSLQNAVSWPALLLFLASVGWSLLQWIRKKNQIQGFLALMVLFFIVELIFLGNADRFLNPIIPFLCLSAGIFIYEVWNLALGKMRIVFVLCLSLITISILAFTINTHNVIQPWGRAGITYSSVKGENYGYEQLDKYLRSVYQERNSSEDLWKTEAEDKTLYIFDSNINYFPKMWYIQRRVTYQGIPFTSSLEFRKLIQENGESYFPQKGYTHYVLIHALSGTLMVPADIRNKVADQMALTLEEQSMQNVMIQRSDGEPAFRVYFF